MLDGNENKKRVRLLCVGNRAAYLMKNKYVAHKIETVEFSQPGMHFKDALHCFCAGIS